MSNKEKIDLYGTYETVDAWITPLGEHRIVHYDCPTPEEIRQRVTDAINELVHNEGFEADCLLCAFMKEEPYGIVYYCTFPCRKCKKTIICKNFNPNE